MSRSGRAFPQKRSSAFGPRGLPISPSSAATRFRLSVSSPARTLYGTHQYGFSENGTVESNKQLTREDLQAFWRQHFVPGNAALVVTGAITLPELRKLAESAFGSWPRGTATPAKLGVPSTAAPRLVIVDRPGSPQTQLARRDVRRAAQQPGLRAGARDEHDSRRHVREPHQHEPARRARLHLRRELAVPVLAQRRAVCGCDRCSHRRHRSGRARSDDRAQER